MCMCWGGLFFLINPNRPTRPYRTKKPIDRRKKKQDRCLTKSTSSCYGSFALQTRGVTRKRFRQRQERQESKFQAHRSFQKGRLCLSSGLPSATDSWMGKGIGDKQWGVRRYGERLMFKKNVGFPRRESLTPSSDLVGRATQGRGAGVGFSFLPFALLYFLFSLRLVLFLLLWVGEFYGKKKKQQHRTSGWIERR